MNDWSNRYHDIKSSKAEAHEIGSTLNSLLNQLPEIQSERERIEKHTNICSYLFEVIWSGLIDEFHEVENELMEKQNLSGELKTHF